MRKVKTNIEQLHIAQHLLRWTLLLIPVSISVGLLVALFLWLLDKTTATREANLYLVFFLPPSGIFIAWMYRKYGAGSEKGNNLIMDEIHQSGGGVPARMTPLVFITTILTHLFGGSAGREGTAVQIGGSTASLLARWFGLSQEDKRIILICGISAGFGAVFGTPVAGAVFALEVLSIGVIRYDALLPSLIAALLADVVCRSCGILHTQYQILFGEESVRFLSYISFDVPLLLKVILSGVLFGLVSLLFASLSHSIKSWGNRYIPYWWLLPVIGGTAVIGISYALGTFDYLGLGVTTNYKYGVSIVSAFYPGGIETFSWFWKLLLTAITLGTGFKGGEVTPLFFIGATLGNVIAVHCGAPVDLFAGLGFIAVFAGATNTPIACTLMGVELFGAENLIYYAVACFTAYYFSGHAGIYSAQRVHIAKMHRAKKQEK